MRPLLVATFLAAASFSLAQSRTVAITVDDLPYAGPVAKNVSAEAVNRKLLAAFQKHNVPVTGFVIQTSADALGFARGTDILKQWVAQGFDLGNHTYSHPDINSLKVEDIQQEIVRGETTFVPLMKEAGRTPRFFRFPMNHTGDTQEKHDALAAFLADRGYQLATCTIDNSDYIFNTAYVKMLTKGDKSGAERVRAEYLAFTGTQIDYYTSLHLQVFGREIPHVMLLHDNPLNADVIEPLLKLFEDRRYNFIGLADAQSDSAYRTPDTTVFREGPMWGYRWARERGITVDGSQEKDPPKWILDYR